jgi:hypothetical protein
MEYCPLNKSKKLSGTLSYIQILEITTEQQKCYPGKGAVFHGQGADSKFYTL